MAPEALWQHGQPTLPLCLSRLTCPGAVQAAFGRQSLSISSIFVYVALVTGLLGNTLSIPFALYVFICQRDQADNVRVRLAQPSRRAALSLCSWEVGWPCQASLMSQGGNLAVPAFCHA